MVKKVKIFETEGKTREEKESVFPFPIHRLDDKNKGAGI